MIAIKKKKKDEYKTEFLLNGFSQASDDTMSFVLEEEVKLQQELLTHLQDQLTKKKETIKLKNT